MFAVFSPKIMRYNFVVVLSTAATHVNIYTHRGGVPIRIAQGAAVFDALKIFAGNTKTQTSRWWNFKYVLCLPGEMIQFHKNIFFSGWVGSTTNLVSLQGCNKVGAGSSSSWFADRF